MGGQRGAGAKYCAPTFNALSDSGVRWAIEAIEGYRIYRGDSTAWVAETVAETVAEAGACLPYDAVAFFAVGVFFSAKPTFFSRSDFFFATVREVSGELRESPWA